MVALRELVKTCNFCLDNCTRKNLHEQIIEGILDGDTVEDLLQEKDLSLARAIQIFQAQEAAKRQRASMSTGHQDSLAAVRNPPLLCRKPLSQVPSSFLKPAQDVVASHILEVHLGALPLAYPATLVAK